ncbi:DapH/DapD/GlmU-related protein [Mycoplasmoides alvi]|uniref:DapH/DapD/GlmU-related protein n=1 Tax=Mycoplasmoides alvi TaxID=78580 RepID=UPI0006988B01|nr:DapH/DapD/GlmU-related protein [Mycoplasmoides alvi]
MEKNKKYNKKHFFVDKTSIVSDNSNIYPGVIIEKNCRIGENVTIQNSSLISNNVVIEDNCFIGPFTIIRENTILRKNSIVGPHCEIVRSEIGKNSKVSHRNYIGDATLGNSVSLGCGVTIANTDFNKRYKAIIGDNTMIGASTTLISPIVIGKNCFIAAGTILSKDLENNTKIRLKLNYLKEKN